MFRCFILAGAVLAAVSVRAATSSLNPSADAFVTPGATGAQSVTNFGGAGALGVSAPGLPQGEFQSVLQFNLAAAKTSFDSQYGVGGWSIQSISLQLSATGPNNAIFNASAAGTFKLLWMQNDSWIEGTGTPGAPTSTGITFSTLSNFVGLADETLGTFNYNGATSGSAVYSLSLTPSFTADALAGNLLSLRMLAADTAISYLSDSRSFGTTAARPLLTITAVPEPSALALGAFSLASFFGRRQRS